MGVESDAVVGSALEEEGGRCRHHRPVLGDLVPVRMVVSLFWMVTVVAVKIAWQPWSQRRPIEIREPEEREGKICARQAAVGSNGISMSAVWLEWMLLPSGSLTAMLEGAGHLQV
jgi:hypothetical protein